MNACVHVCVCTCVHGEKRRGLFAQDEKMEHKGPEQTCRVLWVREGRKITSMVQDWEGLLATPPGPGVGSAGWVRLDGKGAHSKQKEWGLEGTNTGGQEAGWRECGVMCTGVQEWSIL